MSENGDVLWEIGSEFHLDQSWLSNPGYPEAAWLPAGGVLYGSATGALMALLAHREGRPVVHLPSFFCMDVAACLSAHGVIRWYSSTPRTDDWQDGELPAASPGDIVLVQNLFGRASRAVWEDWRAANPGAVLVEDHTHDPMSAWSRTSSASYCVASLRKTLPIADGAVLWSPAGLPLQTATPAYHNGADMKWAAMLLKGAWLRGAPVGKGTFRDLQVRGEGLLVVKGGTMSLLSQVVLALLDAWSLREARAENSRTLVEMLQRSPIEAALLQDGGATDSVPFHVQLVCDTSRIRDDLLAHLREHRVYAAVHWRQPHAGMSSGDPLAIDLADRIITIPTDHRYRRQDMEQVARVIQAFGGRVPP